MADLPLFGIQVHAVTGRACMTDLARRELSATCERLRLLDDARGALWLELTVVRDALGGWWSGFSWSLHSVEHGPCGCGTPIDAFGGTSRAEALRAAAEACAASLDRIRLTRRRVTKQRQQMLVSLTAFVLASLAAFQGNADA